VHTAAAWYYGPVTQYILHWMYDWNFWLIFFFSWIIVGITIILPFVFVNTTIQTVYRVSYKIPAIIWFYPNPPFLKSNNKVIGGAMYVILLMCIRDRLDVGLLVNCLAIIIACFNTNDSMRKEQKKLLKPEEPILNETTS
jgi:hypothetical protein